MTLKSKEECKFANIPHLENMCSQLVIHYYGNFKVAFLETVIKKMPYFCQINDYATILLPQIERDIMIWNHKTYIEKPLLVKEDQSIRRYRHWFSQFYSENSPLFSFQQENTDW